MFSNRIRSLLASHREAVRESRRHQARRQRTPAGVQPPAADVERLESRQLPSASPVAKALTVTTDWAHFGVPVAPVITSIDGYTDGASTVNGLVQISIGTRYNGYRAVNDTAGTYTWRINGNNFIGAASGPGQIKLGGVAVPVLSWTNTKIVIDPSGALFNSTRPWDWTPRAADLLIKTTSGQVTQSVNVVPLVSTRAYGQCTWWVAYRRHQVGLNPSATAYAQTAITAAWVPQAYDTVVFSGHVTFVESVTKSVSGNTTTYSLGLSQYNAQGDNQFSTYQTSFTVTKQPNGQLAIGSLPKFSASSGSATGYYR